MKMAHSMQSFYAPLPQSLSDSDSEKEISMEPICTSYNSKGPSGSTNNFVGNFRQNGHHHHQHQHGINNSDENTVKIKRGKGKMSTSRKIAFIASIIMCFLPIIVFLWILPCSELHACPVKVPNWYRQHKGIELKGPINLVSGAYKSNFNLAILYKSDFNSTKRLKYGIISIMGIDGVVAWDFEQEVEPLGMNCHLLDTNKDGNFDCLVVDSNGLKAIETIAGQTLWHVNSADGSKFVSNLGLPVVLEDFNNDGVAELLSIYEKTRFLIISGKNGEALANIPVPYCDTISSIYRAFNYIIFKCHNSSTDLPQVHKVSLPNLEQALKNRQYRMTIEPDGDEIQENIFISGKKKLIINNGKNCPKCISKLTLLSDEHNQELKTWSYENSYIMNPKPISFESSDIKSKLNGHLYGFIVKIWKWEKNPEKFRPNQRIINKRSLNTNSLFLNVITESVVLITFNDSSIHEINTSDIKINQICHHNYTDCQPSVENHQDSILVEDLENDSSQELVSYYSTYERKEEHFYLVSYMNTVRLEDEMPKLYGNK